MNDGINLRGFRVGVECFVGHNFYFREENMKPIEREQRLYDALKRITMYQPPERLRRDGEKMYGVSGEEAVEMAYENVLGEAKAAIKGMRRPQ
jgi:hypothetical protein